MMKNIFPSLILLSIAGILVFAGTQAQAWWAMIPLAITALIGLTTLTTFKIKTKTAEA